MNLPRLLVLLIVGALVLAFSATLPIVLWGEEGYIIRLSDQVDFLVLVGGFVIALAASAFHVMRALRQYTQALHDLSPEDAAGLAFRLVFGSGRSSAGSPILRVQAGRVDLDGPPVVHRVGGPAGLNVDLHNAVVTSRLGKLRRVLGPGFHNLEPFERVWDVVDLRPQRRTVTVDFVTRDGIPALCQASIVCRIAAPGSAGTGGVSSGPSSRYSERAVLNASTAKVVRKLEGSDRVADWVSIMASGVLERTVRDVLEHYHLDEFLNPQYWLDGEEGPPRTAATPKLVLELEDEIESIVQASGRGRGVIVERVELGMVRPAEAAISRQWLEFWQAKLQNGIDRYTVEAETTHEQMAESARFEAQVMFVNRVLEEVQHLHDEGLTIPPQLVIASFMEVLHSMSHSDPTARQVLIQQAECLFQAVKSVQNEDFPLTASGVPRLPDSPDTDSI